MFRGVYKSTINRNGELKVPRVWNEIYIEHKNYSIAFVVDCNKDHPYLAVVPADELGNIGRKSVASYNDLVSGDIMAVVDRDYLVVTLPGDMRRDKSLEREVMVIGMPYNFQIFDPLIFDEVVKRAKANREKNRKHVAMLRSLPKPDEHKFG